MPRLRPHPVTALLVLALVVAVAWRLTRSDDEPATVFPEAREPAATDDPDTELAGRGYDRGDCVDWDRGRGFTTTDVVPCDEPHLVEMVGRSDLPPDRDDSPSDDEWTDIVDAQCGPLGERYLGRALDPYGRVSPYAIFPTELSWAGGDRDVWCALTVHDPADPDGEQLEPVTARMADVEQARIDPPGTCLATDGLVPVGCAAEHLYEVVAELDVSDLDERPSDDVLFDRCPVVPAGATAPAGGELGVTYVGLEAESWDAGTRRGMCLLAAFGSDDEPIPQTGRMLP